jgi:hypothetical protein
MATEASLEATQGLAFGTGPGRAGVSSMGMSRKSANGGLAVIVRIAPPALDEAFEGTPGSLAAFGAAAFGAVAVAFLGPFLGVTRVASGVAFDDATAAAPGLALGVALEARRGASGTLAASSSGTAREACGVGFGSMTVTSFEAAMAVAVFAFGAFSRIRP